MKALVLNSGGIDSTTCVGIAVDRHGKKNVATVSFIYGQRHAKELKCAEAVAQHYGLKHYVLNIADILKYSDSAMLAGGKEVPLKSYEEQIAERGEGAVDTYVPFRNGLMLSSAAALATSIWPDEEVRIFIGAHRGDMYGNAYADCSMEFVDTMAEAIKIGTYGKVGVDAPLIDKEKKDIIATGLKLSVPYDMTWSCYLGGEKACGKCGTCVEENQRVLMADNTLKPIKEIEEGDEIWAVNEEDDSICRTKVLSKTSKGIRPVYDMNGLLLTKEHEVLARSISGERYFRSYESMKRKDASYQVISWPEIGVRADFNDEKFALGYLRGFVDGDGNVDRGIRIFQKNRDVLDEFWALYNKYITEANVNVKWDEGREIFVANGGYAKLFDEKTEFNESPEYCRGYLNGMIITEGCAVYNKCNRHFSVIIAQSLSASKEKCERIDKCVEVLGFDCTTWETRCGGYLEGGSLMKSYQFSYPYKLPLVYGCVKKEKIFEKINQHCKGKWLPSKSVDKIGESVKEALVYDIETQAHTFICEGYVVHNCKERLAGFHANGVEDPIPYEDN